MGDSQSHMGADPLAAGTSPAASLGMSGGQATDALSSLMQNPSAAAAFVASTKGSGRGGLEGVPETGLLAQLVILLGQRPRGSLLLSDLGALLPGNIRSSVKEKGGLRSWLQRYPELFVVNGSPGKESVTLLLGAAKTGEAAEGDAAKAEAPAPEGQGAEDDGNDAALQLRGLPYKATVSDLRNFLGDHIQNLKDEQSVQLVLNRDGRPSGFARVQFNSPQAAVAAKDALHHKIMEVAGAKQDQDKGSQRYVEVFLYSERPNKLRFKKNITCDGQIPTAGEVTAEDLAALGITKEDVIEQCRVHMRAPGQNRLLLSMLGVALSEAARAYLKKTDQGLKHFLAQYPNEFAVDGAKGRETITFLPATTPEQLAAVQKEQANSIPQTPSTTGRVYQNYNNYQGGGEASYPFNIQTPQPTPQPPPPARKQGQETGYIGMKDAKDWMPQSPKASRLADPFRETPGGQNTPSVWDTPTNPQDRLKTLSEVPGLGSSERDVSAYLEAHRAASRGDPMAMFQEQQMRAMGCGASLGRQQEMPFPQFGFDNQWTAWGMAPNMQGAFPGGAGQAGMGINIGDMYGAMGQNSASNQSFQAAMMQQLLQQQQQQMGMFLHQQQQPAQPAPPAQPMQPAQPTAKAPSAPAAQRPAAGEGAIPLAEVILRGLPLNATEQDVFAFFGKYDIVDLIAESKEAVRLLSKANGKPSGGCVVQMQSRADAMDVVKILNGQYMGSRYIEAFLNPEGPGQAQEGASQPVQPSGPPPTAPAGAGRPAAAASPAVPATAGDGGDTGGSGNLTPAALMRLASSGAFQGPQQAALLQMAGFQIQQQQQAQQQQMPSVKPGDGSGKDIAWEALFGLLKHEQIASSGAAGGRGSGGSSATL